MIMRNGKARPLTLAGAIFLLLTFISQPLQAAKYPDSSKSIEFVVPVGVGGGYDLYVRMIVPYLAKELGVKIRIKNEPGGAWLVGLSQIYKARPDGYTIGIWNPGLLMNDKDILGKVNYDMTTFTYLYRITNEPRVVIVKKDGPIKDFKDLLAKGKSRDFKVRASYAGGTALLDAKLMDSEWGIDTDKIPYKSGNDVRMAVMRGDTHYCVSGLGASAEVMSSERLKIILLLDDEPMVKVGEAQKLIKDYPELKSVPIPKDLGLKPLSYNSRSARAIIAPPGLPKDIKATLENALAKIMKNKELLELGFKTDRPLGIGQSGDDYLAQTKREKQALIKMKRMLEEL
jgi:tripartite-type tricarboxylate transporter receptor subunit TctC